MKFFLSCILAALALASAYGNSPEVEHITIDPHAAPTPFPHFWEQMFGSGRAILSLRESYRRDLRSVKAVTQFRYVRFHAILSDEVGVYDEDAKGNPVYNFSYVDQIYDGLLQNGIRPFVELSFMPSKLSTADHPTVFWYKILPHPPKDFDKWEGLNYAFAKHLVERYGIDEVSQWYFEVWNEPNIDFWAGVPKEPTYYQLYDRAVAGIKRADPRLRVGGPSTAQAAWVDRFLAHCSENHVPVDFASTHVYANDSSENVFGKTLSISRKDMVGLAVAKVHDQILASPFPHIPLIWSEFNASYWNETAVTDSPFMGPWLANTIRMCDGKVDLMSYWSFSDVFEEQGVVKTPFYGGFGLMAAGNIPKPAYNAFKLLGQLGDRRLAASSDDALVTERPDGSLVIAVWNYAPPEKAGENREFVIDFKGRKVRSATISIVDPTHGNARIAWEAMGSPKSPTQAQLQILQNTSNLAPPETLSASGNAIRFTLTTWGLALIDIKR